MKTISSRCLAEAALACFILAAMPRLAAGQSPAVIPAIQFSNVPVRTAMENLARMANLNYIIDPKLFQNADGAMKREPAITIQWENISAKDALARVLKEHNLIMVTNSFSTVVCITDTNVVQNNVDASLLGTGSSKKLPTIRFDFVPLNMAFDELGKHIQTKITLDPRLSGQAQPEPPDFKIVRVPTVSVHWDDLTAQQAIVELCDVYGLEIVKGSAPNTVLIKSRQ